MFNTTANSSNTFTDIEDKECMPIPVHSNNAYHTLLKEITSEYKDLGLVPIPMQWNTEKNEPLTHVQGWDKATPENNPFKLNNSHNALMIRTYGCYACLDIDIKNTKRKTLFSEFYEIILHERPEISDKLYIEKTRNNGYHLWLQYLKLTKKLALASSDGGAEVIALYACSPLVYTYPTPGYSVVQNSMFDVSPLSDEEFEYLISLSQWFNEYKPDYDPKNKAVSYPKKYKKLLKKFDADLPDDAWQQILCDVGLIPYTGFKYQEKHKFKAYKRAASAGDYIGAKVYFQHKRVMIFSASMHDFPNWHNRQDYQVWSLPPSFVLYYKNKRDWTATVEEIRTIMDSIGMDSIKAQRNVETDEIMDDINDQTIAEFWYINDKEKLVLNNVKFLNFLHTKGGFGLFFYNKNSKDFKVIRVVNNVVELTTTEQMKKFLLSYIKTLPYSFDGGVTQNYLTELIIRQGPTLFCDSSLEYLPAFELDFLKDTKETAYIPFVNGVVKITKEGAVLLSYCDINKAIWKNQIKQFNIELDIWQDLKKCEFFDFLEKISGRDSDKLRYCLTLLGYLLHCYKDASKPYAVIFAEETEDDKEGGGTGKGLLIKAIAYLLNLIIIDAKNFKQDKSFNHSRVTLDTQLIVYEDCPKQLDFERFNSQITEGLTVEKKNKDEYFLDYADSPKFAFTTNYTIDTRGNHGKRRSVVFEFSPYFGLSLTPAQEYGHLLFTDWDNAEWNRFYNLLFFCLLQYLIQDLKPMALSEKLKVKQIKNKWGDEFYEYFSNLMQQPIETVRETKKEYNNFLNISGYESKAWPLPKFRKALLFAAGPYHLKAIIGTSKKLGNRSAFYFEKWEGQT